MNWKNPYFKIILVLLSVAILNELRLSYQDEDTNKIDTIFEPSEKTKDSYEMNISHEIEGCLNDFFTIENTKLDVSTLAATLTFTPTGKKEQIGTYSSSDIQLVIHDHGYYTVDFHGGSDDEFTRKIQYSIDHQKPLYLTFSIVSSIPDGSSVQSHIENICR